MPLNEFNARGFASDNCAGVHPDVMSALDAANEGHAASYGEDRHTAALQDTVKEHFGAKAVAFPVFNGTGANVLSLQSMTTRRGGIICAGWSHINCDEGGAPEKVGGLKLLTTGTNLSGKITLDEIDALAHGFDDEHRAQPEVLSLTQTSELGRVYSVDELQSLTNHAHSLGLKVHMDGARVSNAAAALGVPLRAITTDVGVDVLSFGGTKNGLMFGELVITLTNDDPDDLRFLRKTNMQLASKLRFISAQFNAILSDDLWLNNAAHANAMAARLHAGLVAIDSVEIILPVEANAIFAKLPPAVAQQCSERVGSIIVDPAEGIVRLMTSFDTTESDVNSLLESITA